MVGGWVKAPKRRDHIAVRPNRLSKLSVAASSAGSKPKGVNRVSRSMANMPRLSVAALGSNAWTRSKYASLSGVMMLPI